MAAKLLTPREFARKIRHGTNYVMALIRNGEIEFEDHRRPGASLPRYMIDPEQATKWRESRRRRFKPPPAQDPQRRARSSQRQVAEVIQ